MPDQMHGIDLEYETPIPLRVAAKHRLFRAKSSSGRGLNFSTIWRWSLRGVRGVKLDTVRIGSTLCTSEAAIVRFVERLTNPATPAALGPSARRRAHKSAVKELAAAGAV